MRRRITHFVKRRRNRVLVILMILNVILVFLLYSNLVTYPNTMLGTTDISGKTTEQIQTLLKKQVESLPKIQVKNRVYQYTYQQMGIVIDTNRALTDIFAPNKKPFPENFVNFLQSLFSKRHIIAPLVFTQNFDQFISDMTFNFNMLPDEVSVDDATKTLLVTENDQNYRFDKESLRILLTEHFGSYEHPIYPMLAKVTNETIIQVHDTNQKLQSVFSSPIMMYLDMGGSTQAVQLNEEDIREVTSVSVDPETLEVTITVNSDKLNSLLTDRIRATGFPIRKNIVTDSVRDDLLKAIQLRYSGNNISAIASSINDGANTDGSLASSYIEVDISQQKMYLFRDGKIYKSYSVSTGLDYPTPIGKFSILNKSGLGYSKIYNVWMPWWMGFSYSNKLHAFFGIHEQPYRLSSDGTPVTRTTIGSPSTGGCIALAPGAAQEVYSFARIGTPVYIYN